MARRSRQQWEQIAREQESSGLSVEQFAHRRRLNVATLRYWKWVLARTPTRNHLRRPAEPVRLLPVRVAPPAPPQSASVMACSVRVSIIIAADELRVDVPLDADARDIARLVAVLRTATC